MRRFFARGLLRWQRGTRLGRHPGLDLVGWKVQSTIDNFRNRKAASAAPTPQRWQADIERRARSRPGEPTPRAAADWTSTFSLR
jgi:hypothetical protein